MAAPKGHKKYSTAVGVKGKSGRRTAREETKYFDKIDKALPHAVDYCLRLIMIANSLEDQVVAKNASDFEKKELYNKKVDYHTLAVRAANSILNKAPERHVGGLDGTKDLGVVILPTKQYGQKPDSGMESAGETDRSVGSN